MIRDDEMKGAGNVLGTHFRQNDTRLGRWWGRDPMQAKYPSMSAYSSMGNNPNFYTDPFGSTLFVNNESGELNDINDGHDITISVNSAEMNDAQELFTNDNQMEYLAKLELFKESNNNIGLTKAEFIYLSETLYVESSGKLNESIGIINVLENRAENEHTELMNQVTDKAPYGVYGVRKTGDSKYKYSYNNETSYAADLKRKIMHIAIAIALTTSDDLSNGGYFWDGKDFNGKNRINGGYRKRYLKGYLFNNPSHDLWNQGDYPIVSSNGKVHYLYESTNALGSTTFSKIHNQGDKWYIQK